VEATVRELTDFTVSLLDDLDCAAFPAVTVLDVLAPRLEAEISNYARMEGRHGLVSMVAPGCSRNGPVILDWLRRNPANSLFQLIAGEDGPPVSAEARAGGRAAWTRDPTQQFIESLTGCDETAAVPLTATADGVTGLFFGRHGRDFTDSELAFLASVQPLLRAVARHARRIAGWRQQCPDAQQAARAGRDAGLTARELDVLRLMARGLTAASVARRLGCSPRTAEKHAANLYRKLDVNDRLSAVLTAQRRGLLP
jgi:DNA-binding CsgD family transcriptional regulator